MAEIFAECPWSPKKTTQSCFLLILHAGSWHLRAGKHRHARPTMRHHDPLVTKSLQHGVVWKREVVRKIVVDLFILSNQMHACMQLLAHTHAHARPRPCTEKQKRAKKRCFACASTLEPVCVNVCLCAKLLNISWWPCNAYQEGA